MKARLISFENLLEKDQVLFFIHLKTLANIRMFLEIHRYISLHHIILSTLIRNNDHVLPRKSQNRVYHFRIRRLPNVGHVKNSWILILTARCTIFVDEDYQRQCNKGKILEWFECSTTYIVSNHYTRFSPRQFEYETSITFFQEKWKPRVLLS